MILDIFTRLSETGDKDFLKSWLCEPKTQKWFPISNAQEAEVISTNWVDHYKIGSAFTTTLHGEPIAMGVLYLTPFQKLKHQCELAMIVRKDYRGNGVGTHLLLYMMSQAKKFKIEYLYLHVYEKNPAIKFYREFKFKEYGEQPAWLMEDDCTTFQSRILMQRKIK